MRPKKTPKARVTGLYHASDAQKLTLVFDAEPPNFEREEGTFREWEKLHRDDYLRCARRIADEFDTHLPGGLIDALLAELCLRRASILRVHR